MKPADPHLMTLFSAALEYASEAERAAYLDRACAGDVALKAEVEGLLRAHGEAGGFLEARNADSTVSHLPSEGPGTQIGPYKLLEVIGEGGMGVVYLAQQTEPVKRLVALKVIKAGMDSRQVLARFEAERQALALMDHPNIAKVLDAGTTGERRDVSPPVDHHRRADASTLAGRPYFVMELVKGVPITRFCDERKLTPRERLELFLPVCHAIQHAHQKGIIHRDIKPTNVLVALYDGKPVPKVIDFGVAKAAGQPLTEKTLVTGLGAVVGTPEYMSPEQAELNQLDIDTRSDVYSLGVLLYELLTGTTPLTRKRLKEAALLEVLRVIREEEPQRPSTRLSTTEELPSIAASRGTEPARLSRLVRGELDWVVMKALEKDRNRRYGTANGFAMDVQRYLADEPLLACPPSARYRLRKFVRRNRRAVGVGVLVAASLLVAVGGVAGSVGWASRDRAARLAEAAREQQVRDSEREHETNRALDEAARYRDQRDWVRASAALHRAEWLAAQGASDVIGQRIRDTVNDLRMTMRLEELFVEDPKRPFYNVLDRSILDPAYGEAFRNYGINVEALDAAEAAERIRTSAIGPTLVEGLHEWMWIKLCKLYNSKFFQYRPDIKEWETRAESEYEHLRTIADMADPDDWARRVRDRQVQGNLKELEKLAARPEMRKTPSVALFVARLLHFQNANRQAVALLSALQEQNPSEFLVNYSLGVLIGFDKARQQEAIGFLRAAVAIRPQYQSLRQRLSDALRNVRKK
jgi:serine/threonine protein kinase